MRDHCAYKRITEKDKYCCLKNFQFKTENAEINVCGNCSDFISEDTDKFINKGNGIVQGKVISNIYRKFLERDKPKTGDLRCKNI